jgi:class 3 adenylate cyclase
MHVQPYQQVWRRVAVACTVPLHREPAAAARGLVRLILLMAALPMIGMVVATPIRPRGRGPGGAPEAHADTAPGAGMRPRPWATLPVHRSIFAVDIENSTQRTNPVKEELRQHVYRLVVEALSAAGIDDHYYDPFTDRGDGVLVLVHPADEFPKPLLLSRLMPALASLLVTHNSSISPAEQPRILRLRAVIHAGEVHYDGKGFFGEDLDVAFRLLDAPKFKAHLRRGSVPLALVASDDIYRSVIRHGYEGIDGDEFLPLVSVTVADRRRKGWVHFPRAGGFPVAVPAYAC